MALQAPTNGKPNDPGNRSWAWGWIGSAVGTVLSPFIPMASSIGLLGGLVVGQISGQKRKERELATGVKEVRKPNLFNGGLAKGLIWGSVVGLGVGLLVGGAALAAAGGLAVAANGIGAMIGIVEMTAATQALIAMPAAIGTLAGFATNTVMAIQGSIRRRDEMRDDYEMAKKWHTQKATYGAIDESYHRAPEMAHSFAPTRATSQSPKPRNAQDFQFDNSAMIAKRGDRKWVESTAPAPQTQGFVR